MITVKISYFKTGKKVSFFSLLFVIFLQSITAQKSALPGLNSENACFRQPDFVYNLPFIEEWESGGFTQNQWDISEDSAWVVKGFIGNGGACAQFDGSSMLTDYSSTLSSRWLAGDDHTIGNITLKFDLKLVSFSTESNTEVLYIRLFNGRDYIDIDSIKNFQSFDWTHYSYEISNLLWGNAFKIVFEATGEDASKIMGWSIDNIEVFRECGAPREIEGHGFYLSHLQKQSTSNPETGKGIHAVVNWRVPDCLMPADSLEYYGSGNNYHGVGLTSGGDMRVAIRWDARSLNSRNGDTIKKIYYFLRGHLFDKFIIHIWTGHNGANTVYTDTVENPAMFEWGEHVLKDTVIFHSTLEYWVGYDLINVDMALNIAGADEGPAIKGFGDKISSDHGITWNNISDFDLNYNWNIKLLFSGQKPADSALKSFVIYKSNIHSDSVAPYDTVEYDHHNTSFDYSDYNVEDLHKYYYKVNAVWQTSSDTCISAFADNIIQPWDDDYVIIAFPPDGVTEKQSNDRVEIYPNPANEMITIRSEYPVSCVAIMDMMGRIVLNRQGLNSGKVTLNISALSKGAYFVKVVSGNRYLYGRIIVQ